MNDVILRLASRRRSPLECGLPVLSDDLHHVKGNHASVMEHFIAYHSAQRMGYEYGSSGALAFYSKKLSLLKKAIGNTVWVVQGIPDGKRTAYTLCGAYVADSVAPESPSSSVYVIRGSQETEFAPPLPLNKLSWFPALLKSQGNFSLGFNRLSDESVVLALSALQSKNSESSFTPSLPDIDLSFSLSEGGHRLVSHLQRERKPALVEAKKAATLSAKGNLSCEACDFDFSATYGRLGEGFCEVHHLTPLSASGEAVTTTLADLAVLCSNCHRIIHRSDPMLSVTDLSKVIRNGRPTRHSSGTPQKRGAP